ncbi:COG1361 S-layer family protein [Methanococcoides methylutens]|uniref:COG1361 S-layer family protein n=1 Tax=Methanococcoides methylutens TaxID=2226 RepID=UPI0040451610
MKQLLAFVMLFLALSAVQVHGESVPPNIWAFDDDYFTVHGSPEMVVSIAGSPEYDRGESSAVLIQIMNQGKILGFESENEPDDANEVALSMIEQEMEYDVTTAVGVIASLSAKDAPLDIKTPPQSAGTLFSGQVSQPVQFEIQIWDGATAGTYPLEVNLSYQFQKDVQVEGDATSNQIDRNILYREVNESHNVFVIIRKDADFEVMEVDSELLPGSSGILTIKFKNTGEETASRATARLRLSDPLSSTDYTAFLGDMEPGDEVQTMFNIDVDPDATAKTYSIKAEIEYEDHEGKTKVSDIIYVPAQVEGTEDRGAIYQNPFLLGGGLLILAVLAYGYMKRREGGSSND